MTGYESIERIAKNGYAGYIRQLIRSIGIKFRLFKKSPTDEYENVYGVDSGVESDSEELFKGLLVTYDMTPIDTISSGTFVEGYLYTDATEVEEGDHIEVVRKDGRTRKYKIMNEEQAGMVLEVFTRWRVVSVNN